MRERPENGGQPGAGEEAPRRRIELSVPQVAGSAVAAVVAAKLASYFGVYGTILGAGLVSVVATCGGSVFQHFFRRTGEQIRTVTVPVRPVVDEPSGTPPLPSCPVPGEFSEGTVYRARVKSWKRPLVAAALVFGVTMGGITAYEVLSGSSFSGGHGTTVGDAVTGRHRGPSSPPDGGTPEPSSSPGSPGSSTGTGDGATPGGDGGPSDGPGGGASVSPTPTPGASTGTGSGDPGGTDGASPEPGGTPGEGTHSTPGTGGGTTPAPGGPSTAPAPAAGGRSGTAGPDRGGPAAP
ncbi:hypothetical protein [Streptomyces sp. PsTaAH-124]|uniref:hypothetical protein n=1 Tax=Streptomyces sp. PsTaAH-124 TaxID=1157638 RepID=UPI0004779FEC|nr:hypothetical protein [Streptomyces sp. PsTaAH-124]